MRGRGFLISSAKPPQLKSAAVTGWENSFLWHISIKLETKFDCLNFARELNFHKHGANSFVSVASFLWVSEQKLKRKKKLEEKGFFTSIEIIDDFCDSDALKEKIKPKKKKLNLKTKQNRDKAD